MRTEQRSRMFFVGMLALIGAASQASATPLSDLLRDPYMGILHGDMLFDNFSLAIHERHLPVKDKHFPTTDFLICRSIRITLTYRLVGG